MNGSIANFFNPSQVHAPHNLYAPEGGGRPSEPEARTINYRLPAPCDRFTTVCYTASHLRPLELTLLKTGLPHLLASIDCSGPDWDHFLEVERARVTQEAALAGQAPRPLNMQLMEQLFRRMQICRMQTESAVTYLEFLENVGKETKLYDPRQRAAAQQQLNKIWTANNSIGQTARDVAKWMLTQTQKAGSNNFACFRGLPCHKDDSELFPSVVSSMLSSIVFASEHALKAGSLHMHILTALLVADVAPLTDNDRLQLGIIFFGQYGKGKSWLTRQLAQLRNGVHTVTYSSEKADTVAANDGAHERIIDDAGPDALGMAKGDRPTSYNIALAAKQGAEVLPTNGCARLKAARTSIYHTYKHLFIDKDGKRKLQEFACIKYGSMFIGTNIYPFFMEAAVASRFLQMPVMSGNRTDWSDQVSSRIDAVTSDGETGPDVIKDELKRQIMCRQGIVNVWALLAKANGMAKPCTRWAAAWLDVCSRYMTLATQMDVRQVRPVDAVVQMCHLLAQYRAIGGYDIGLCQRPDAAEPFSYTHFDGLSHAAVADLDCVVPLMDAAGLILDPLLVAVCFLIREWDAQYRRDFIGIEGGAPVPLSQGRPHVVYPKAFVALPEREQAMNLVRLDYFVNQLMGFAQSHPITTASLGVELVASKVGTLMKNIFVHNERTLVPGLYLFTQDNKNTCGIMIHPAVLKLGDPAFDPIEDCILACTPGDYPASVVVRSRIKHHDVPDAKNPSPARKPKPDYAALQPIRLKQDVSRHPVMRQHLALMRERLSMRMDDAALLDEVIAAYDDPLTNEEVRRDWVNPTIDLAHELGKVVRFNSNGVTHSSYQQLRQQFPAAARRIQCSGILEKPVVDEITFGGLEKVHETHLRSLGVEDRWIPRWYSMPRNWSKCFVAYYESTRRLLKLQESTDHYRELLFLRNAAQRTRDYQPTLLKAFEGAVLGLLDMFQRFAYHGNFLRWHLHREPGTAAVGEDQTIPLEAGYRMSVQNVLSYLTPVHLGRDAVPGLDEVVQQLSWIGLQEKYIDGTDARKEFPREFDDVRARVCQVLATQWCEKEAPNLPAPNWTSFSARQMPQFEHPTHARDGFEREDAKSADQRFAEAKSPPVPRVFNPDAPLVRALLPVNGVQEAAERFLARETTARTATSSSPPPVPRQVYVGDETRDGFDDVPPEPLSLPESPLLVPSESVTNNSSARDSDSEVKEQGEEEEEEREEQPKQRKKKRTHSKFVDDEAAQSGDDEADEGEEQEEEEEEEEEQDRQASEAGHEAEEGEGVYIHPNPYAESDEEDLGQAITGRPSKRRHRLVLPDDDDDGSGGGDSSMSRGSV
jgi:hypothetical protein